MKTNNNDLAAVPSTALLGDFSESDYNALMYFCTESSPERWCEWEAKLNAIRYLYPEFIAALELKRKATSHFYAVVDAMKYPPNPGVLQPAAPAGREQRVVGGPN